MSKTCNDINSNFPTSYNVKATCCTSIIITRNWQSSTWASSINVASKLSRFVAQFCTWINIPYQGCLASGHGSTREERRSSERPQTRLTLNHTSPFNPHKVDQSIPSHPVVRYITEAKSHHCCNLPRSLRIIPQRWICLIFYDKMGKLFILSFFFFFCIIHFFFAFHSATLD